MTIFFHLKAEKKATVKERMHAIAAHEMAELLSEKATSGARHADAIIRSANNEKLPPATRAIIKDQAIRVAKGNFDVVEAALMITSKGK